MEEKNLKKKRLRRIEEALDEVTYKADGRSVNALHESILLLEFYHLVTNYSITYSYTDKTVMVKLQLTELGKQVATIIYGGARLPPINSGIDISFADYEVGFTLTDYSL